MTSFIDISNSCSTFSLKSSRIFFLFCCCHHPFVFAFVYIHSCNNVGTVSLTYTRRVCCLSVDVYILTPRYLYTVTSIYFSLQFISYTSRRYYLVFSFPYCHLNSRSIYQLVSLFPSSVHD